jgi:catechol 2,3-dioxygenase-like lactoylglutathione lyase family enzyme
MIHHVSLGTNDAARARTFYDPIMDLLGLKLLRMDMNPDALHYGSGETQFSIMRPADGQSTSPGNGVHIAFQAQNRDTVRRFHELALANGGSCDGAPGLRPEYNAHYYAAFVRDPDGNKIEAVTHSPG